MAQELQNAGIVALATHIRDTYLGSAIGTGTTAMNPTDTTLEGEQMRVASTNTLITTTVTNDTAQMTATFNISTGMSIAKAAQFTSSTSGGTMLSEALFTALPLVNGDSIITIWKYPISGV
jgi:hypothetical protein